MLHIHYNMIGDTETEWLGYCRGSLITDFRCLGSWIMSPHKDFAAVWRACAYEVTNYIALESREVWVQSQDQNQSLQGNCGEPTFSRNRNVDPNNTADI